MSMRVATFNSSARMLATTLSTQARLAELQIQQATGKISVDYGGLGSTAGSLIGLEVSAARAQSFATAASLSRHRVEVMYDACGSLIDILAELRAEVMRASGSLDTVGAQAINDVARGMWGEAASLMNTRFEGRYLFAGSCVDTAPVDLSALEVPPLPALPPPMPMPENRDYYNGDDAITSVRVSNDNVLEYGVTANHDAFEKTMRVFTLVVNYMTWPFDQAIVDEANSLVLEAMNEMTAVQTLLSLDARALERAEQDQLDFVDFAKAMESDLGDVDIAAVAARISTYEAQLQASYSAIGKIQGLRLVDYLR
ncbi:MAG: flagellin [Methylacidiphilales bacterium]|nr:flagellin [Candidatus Methylacidiphilales bacterium]